MRRAVTIAVKLAIEPPLVNKPPPRFEGKLYSFNNQLMVTISNSAAAGDATQPPENTLKPVANVSAIVLT